VNHRISEQGLEFTLEANDCKTSGIDLLARIEQYSRRLPLRDTREQAEALLIADTAIRKAATTLVGLKIFEWVYNGTPDQQGLAKQAYQGGARIYIPTTTGKMFYFDAEKIPRL
jgi:hypothetical protein